MGDKSRRLFISNSLLTFSSMVVANPIANPMLWDTKIDSDSSLRLISECMSVHHQWMLEESIDPDNYLKLKIIRPDGSRKNLSEVTKADFKDNNFFVINGLTLGKTEASLLAILGASLDSNVI